MQLKIENTNHRSVPHGHVVPKKNQSAKLPKIHTLAIACLMASGISAATVITAENAFQVTEGSFVPKPQRASKVSSSAITTAAQSHNRALTPMNAQNSQALYLVRSTLLALDQANQTGNYSVLRALGTPKFSARNSSADLAIIFSNLRRSKVDLAEAALLTPHWHHPSKTQDNGLRLRGVLPMNSREIYFDLHFKSISGQWRIYALHVSPRSRDATKTIQNISRKKPPSAKTHPVGQSSNAKDATTGKTLTHRKSS